MTAWRSSLVTEWERRGTYRHLAGHRTFTVDVPAAGEETLEPLLVLHGFPTCSFDLHQIVDELAAHRRVLLLDMIGYGLSAKPDAPYTVALQADVIEAFVADAGVARLALLTHDLGDTVGGELLARHLDGAWPVEITRRVITNGSIYIEMAHLSVGQQMLLALPDERLPAEAGIDGPAMKASLAATFSPRSPVDDDGLDAAWEMISYQDGQRLLPRTIRYIEERRAQPGTFHRRHRAPSVPAVHRVGDRRPHRRGAHGGAPAGGAPRRQPDVARRCGALPDARGPGRLSGRGHRGTGAARPGLTPAPQLSGGRGSRHMGHTGGPPGREISPVTSKPWRP